MKAWKQAGLAAATAAAAVAGWAFFLPASHPYLDRVGLLDPLRAVGLVSQPDAAAPDGAPATAGGPPAGAAPPGGGQGGGGRPSGPPAAVVVAEAPGLRQLADVVTAVGTGRGVRSVVVAAEVTGRLTALPIAPGSRVTAGQVVAELDSEAARIALDRATLILADARANHARVQQLAERGAATDLQMQEAELALKQAELELREAEFELSRHRILAPIDGWAGLLDIDVGDRISAGQEVLRIEDRSSLLVDFRVPERVVSRLAPGDALTATPLADPGLVLPGTIVAMDNRVDETSRSLSIQARIDNAGDALRSGMAFAIDLAFTGDDLPSVDPLAIQWGASGAYVWIVRQDKAARLPVVIRQRNADSVLVDAAFEPGDLVVVEGVTALRPGAPVKLAPGRGAALAVAAPVRL
ncbi:MAG: efflux RND transporter periplasmic adaptor subunit [Rhodobacterales bacterium]|nr:efflux RND transporter periplasmic adaptor subunit [Rhodobacterales bacterium]